MIKKIFVFLIFIFLLINIYAENKFRNGDKYYHLAVKYYLQGDLDNAINILTRALQIDKDNIHYSELYDLILSEKEKLTIIKLDLSEYKRNDDINTINYNELISKITKYVNKKEQQQNKRILNLIDSLSKENTDFKKNQEILGAKINENAVNISKVNKNFTFLVVFIILLIIVILTGLILLINFIKKIKKLNDNIKLLTLKQNEQQDHLLKIEEAQKRLESKLS